MRAKGFVPQYFKLPVGTGETPVIDLQHGVTVRGRVLNAGQPVPGVAIGAGWTNRRSGAAWGPWETLTNEAGEFAITGVTPDRAINLYVKMRSLKQLGAISPRKLTTGADESVLDVGDLNVGVGHTVSGRVELSTGGPLPAGFGYICHRRA